MWTPVKAYTLLFACPPKRLVPVEEVPIDPEAMVAIEELDFSVCGWSAAECTDAVSEG